MIASSPRPTSRAAAFARSRKGETVISMRAPESRSWWASSPGVYSEFALVTIAFARSTPWNAATQYGLFGAKMPTTSPAPIPRSASAAATLSTIPVSSPNVTLAPEPPSISAGAPARSPNPSANRNSGRETSGISTSG
jgi:hypothetical protein